MRPHDQCAICSFTAALSAIVFAGAAHADFTGLYVESFASNTLTNTTLVGRTYKIYAQFDNPADRFVSAITTGMFFGGDLYQDQTFGTNLGPHPAALDAIFANLAADSYVAVNGGTPTAGPGWNDSNFTNGISIDGSWFMSDPFSPASSPDANGRVLIMFLTFTSSNLPVINGLFDNPSADHIDFFVNHPLCQLIEFGDLSLSYQEDGQGISGTIIHFGILGPSPGGFALLGVAALAPRRRRKG